MSKMKYIVRFLLLMLFVFSFNLSKSQIVANPFEEIREKKEVIFGIDNRRTHILEQHTVIYGIYTGIGSGRKLRFKVGINGTPFEVGRLKNDQNETEKTRLFFFCLGEEFDFIHFNKTILTTYLQIGIGNSFYKTYAPNGSIVKRGSGLILPIELGLQCSFELNAYLKLKAGFGWRFVPPVKFRTLDGYFIKAGLSFNYRKYLEQRRQKHNERSEN